MDHDSIVEDWRQNAQAHDEKNYKFLRSLKFREYGFDPDKLAGKLHEQAFQIVDCTRCANCCKTLNVRFDDADIERIAGHLNMSTDEFIATYLEVDQERNVYTTRQTPCPFLGQDDRCTIYEVRPTVCQEYPYTNKEGLVFRTMGVANNTLVCPAVYWIVEQMRRRARK